MKQCMLYFKTQEHNQASRFGGIQWFNFYWNGQHLPPAMLDPPVASCCLLEGHHTTRPYTSCQLYLSASLQLTVYYTMLWSSLRNYCMCIAKFRWLTGAATAAGENQKKAKHAGGKAGAAPVS